MIKRELASRVAKKVNMSHQDILIVFDSILDHVKEVLGAGESIYLRGFGTFTPKKRAAKTGRNITKNSAVHIPAHYKPIFRPGKEFKDRLLKLEIKPDQYDT
jgi:DNA-binding protein HU-beta